MKFVSWPILILSLVLASSCGKTENGFNKLSEAEKAALRLRAQEKCKTDNNPFFDDFKSDSAISMFSDKRFNRHANYKFTSTVAGTTGKQEGTIQVWKQASDYIIFHVINTGFPANNYFLRLTKAQNDLMIDNLRDDFCTRSPVPIFESGASVRNGGPVTFRFKYQGSTVSGKATSFVDSFNLSFEYPVFFANYNLARVETSRPVDAETGEVDTNDANATVSNYKTTLAAGELAAFTQAHTNTVVFGQKYCELPLGTSGKYRVESSINSFGYKMPDVDACPATAAAAGWNMTVTN